VIIPPILLVELSHGFDAIGMCGEFDAYDICGYHLEISGMATGMICTNASYCCISENMRRLMLEPLKFN
jgi:hypothetical protein